jgi:hypothetical protein
VSDSYEIQQFMIAPNGDKWDVIDTKFEIVKSTHDRRNEAVEACRELREEAYPNMSDMELLKLASNIHRSRFTTRKDFEHVMSRFRDTAYALLEEEWLEDGCSLQPVEVNYHRERKGGHEWGTTVWEECSPRSGHRTGRKVDFLFLELMAGVSGANRARDEKELRRLKVNLESVSDHKASLERRVDELRARVST